MEQLLPRTNIKKINLQRFKAKKAQLSINVTVIMHRKNDQHIFINILSNQNFVIRIVKAEISSLTIEKKS